MILWQTEGPAEDATAAGSGSPVFGKRAFLIPWPTASKGGRKRKEPDMRKSKQAGRKKKKKLTLLGRDVPVPRSPEEAKLETFPDPSPTREQHLQSSYDRPV